jgi:hypothetical protein
VHGGACILYSQLILYVALAPLYLAYWHRIPEHLEDPLRAFRPVSDAGGCFTAPSADSLSPSPHPRARTCPFAPAVTDQVWAQPAVVAPQTFGEGSAGWASVHAVGLVETREPEITQATGRRNSVSDGGVCTCMHALLNNCICSYRTVLKRI